MIIVSFILLVYTATRTIISISFNLFLTVWLELTPSSSGILVKEPALGRDTTMTSICCCSRQRDHGEALGELEIEGTL